MLPSPLSGCSLVVELLPSKQIAGVRFSPSALAQFSMIKVDQDWWKRHFTLDYYKTYVDFTSSQKTKDETSFLRKVLGLEKQKRKILDLGCGVGRHSIELANLGHSVTGIDYSSEYISIAKNTARKQDLEISFLKADMRRFSSEQKFDVVVSIFSSFGYFSDSDNEKVIENVAKLLKRGGTFILDLHNPARVFKHFFCNSDSKETKGGAHLHDRRIDTLSNGLEILTDEEFDIFESEWKMDRKWRENGETKRYKLALRIYTLPEIRKMLEERGLKLLSVFGDFKVTTPYNVTSKRMIVVAEKM